jgi:hypothetical protein
MNAARKLMLTAVAILLFFLVDCLNAVSGEPLHVAIPTDRLGGDGRVVGFAASIVSGRVSSLPNVPIGWYITIDNDPSWRTKIKGTIIVGAAALDPKHNPAFFEHFLTIEEEPSSDVPLDIQLEIVTTTDFTKERNILLKRSDLKIGRGGQRGPGMKK